jgi:hypothetical protein
MNIFKTLWDKLRSFFSGGGEQYVSILPKDDEVRTFKKRPPKVELKSPSTEFGKSTGEAIKPGPALSNKRQDSLKEVSARPQQTQKEIKEEPVKVAPVEVKPVVQETVQPVVQPVVQPAVEPEPSIETVPVPELPIDVRVPPLSMEDESAAERAVIAAEEKPAVEPPVTLSTISTPAVSENGAKRRFTPYEINEQTAQRLARLLVSEIKLYYANKAENIPKENLYDSLKGPIDKSRQHYRERLGTEFDKLPNYFHEELVKSLCEGDVSRLGPNYEK